MYSIYKVISHSEQDNWNKIFYHIRPFFFFLSVMNLENHCTLSFLFLFLISCQKDSFLQKLFHCTKTACTFFIEKVTLKIPLNSSSHSGNRWVCVICWNVLQSLQRIWMIGLCGWAALNLLKVWIFGSISCLPTGWSVCHSSHASGAKRLRTTVSYMLRAYRWQTTERTIMQRLR